MGILNVTPDSFSDGGQFLDPERACQRAKDMVEEGASIVDVGGASSRPKGKIYGEGASLISADEELTRILPVITGIVHALPHTWISVDTFRSDVAAAALDAGAHMINDITALRFDPRIAEVAAAANIPIALMHSVGLPGEMPHVVETDDIVARVAEELAQAGEQARMAGCQQVIVDPGFGFGKTHVDNLKLIENTNTLAALGLPVLIGVSRKTTIGWASGPKNDILPPQERLPGSLAVTAVGVMGGASIVRTHDVAETRRFLSAMYATSATGTAKNGSRFQTGSG